MVPKLSRRRVVGDLLALATIAPVASCASLPQVHDTTGTHRCAHRHCRYFRAEQNEGRCALLIRTQGGDP
ncbi:MAG: hypothetical protein HY791_07670 [Deltaproteobacteria bacterium]|nr:hypothetical protein [Deltaproteobacteria bacterium]